MMKRLLWDIGVHCVVQPNNIGMQLNKGDKL